MRINLIACTNKTDSIGDKGELLYKFDRDLQYFKRTTMGSCVIMGAKTFLEIGRELPGRLNVVVADMRRGRPEFIPANVIVKNSLDDALHYLFGNVSESKKIFIIGGASLYNEALINHRKIIDRVYLNVVVDNKVGDTKIDTMQLQYVKETFDIEGHTTMFDTNHRDNKTYCIDVTIYKNPSLTNL